MIPQEKCPHCGLMFARTSVNGYPRKGFEQHVARCKNATEAERKYFRLRRSWPVKRS